MRHRIYGFDHLDAADPPFVSERVGLAGLVLMSGGNSRQGVSRVAHPRTAEVRRFERPLFRIRPERPVRPQLSLCTLVLHAASMADSPGPGCPRNRHLSELGNGSAEPGTGPGSSERRPARSLSSEEEGGSDVHPNSRLQKRIDGADGLAGNATWVRDVPGHPASIGRLESRDISGREAFLALFHRKLNAVTFV